MRSNNDNNKIFGQYSYIQWIKSLTSQFTYETQQVESI